jgi:hypothetical protein
MFKQHHTLLDLFRKRQGRGDFASLENIRSHAAHHLNSQLKKHGAPVVLTTPPWSSLQLDAAVQRGPHRSATEHLEFLRTEMADMVKKAIWMVLPYSLVKDLKDLRISPIGVVPQHDRRPRTIVDYSFYGLNDETLRLAPREAMQFGRALERILRQIVQANPKFGPVNLIKIDLADGFYRVWVRTEDIPKLGVSFPQLEGEEPLVAFPLSLPMGWTESPPYFCSVTETVADVANERLFRWRNPPSHHLEADADSSAPAPSLSDLASKVIAPTAISLPLKPDPNIAHRKSMLAAIDIFVDDFIGIAQGDALRLARVRRILMHAIDDVLRPNDQLDSIHRKEPISVKKLRQGDAHWDTCKKVLGWIIDTVSMTITLPERRLSRLADLLSDIPRTQKRMSLRRWHALLGELRSMSLALPGSRGLFSHLQVAIKTQRHNRLRLHRGFHDAIEDFRWLHRDLASRPTRLFELVPQAPTIIGAHDASGVGAGGVWLPTSSSVSRAAPLLTLGSPSLVDAPTTTLVVPTASVPILWRLQFPVDISRRLVSFSNPTGDINNSDLELAGGVLHDDVAAHCFDIRERTTRSNTDNSATLFWHRKGSVTTKSPPAYLLRLSALHQRHHRYLPLKDYLPGDRNTMADDASRLFSLSNAALLKYFNTRYPQKQSWHLWTPRPPMTSAVILALSSARSNLGFLQAAPAAPMDIGTSGPRSASASPSILPWRTSKIQWRSSKSLPIDIVTDPLPLPGNRSDLEQWRMPYGVLGKRLRVWGPQTPVLRPKEKLISGLNASSPSTASRIHLLTG